MSPNPPTAAVEPPCLVLLGKLGDIINSLPIAQHYAARFGQPTSMVVARRYAAVLEGCSYVKPEPFDGDFFTGLTLAASAAQTRHKNVLVLQTNGDGFKFERQARSFCLEPFILAGLDRAVLPLTFDRRDPARESELVKRAWPDPSRPLVLYSLKGFASPFDAAPEFETWLHQQFGESCQLWNTNTARPSHIFDLLALYERASALITIDTATLHLTAATPNLPFVFFSPDKFSPWHASIPKGNCVLQVQYKAVLQHLDLVKRRLDKALNRVTPKPKPQVVVRRTAAIGDTIAASFIAQQLSQRGLNVVWQVHPNILPIARRLAGVAKAEPPLTQPQIDLDGVYEVCPDRRERHFNAMFADAANRQLKGQKVTPTNCRPRLLVAPAELEPFKARLSNWPRPWVFVSPRSNSWPHRTVPASIWQAASANVEGTCFWIGTDPAPPGLIDLKIRQLEDLVLWLACADLAVSVDTGPLHIAAALGVPCVALEQSSSPQLHLSDQRDFLTIEPTGNLECLNCQLDTCPKNPLTPPCQLFDPQTIASAINRRLNTQLSAVIPTHRPTTERLNSCLTHVLPQVDEVVVSLAADGQLPPNILRHSKVKIVQHRFGQLGFGRNVNFGVRHSNGKRVLILNDDVYLTPEAARHLNSAMTGRVGLVGHLLRYPNGRIQHGGKFRRPGVKGWGHFDYNKTRPSINSPVECENVTAASILVDRRAFYEAAGFDEDFHMYGEDDAFALQIRQAGWKIVYTPLAVGIHLESQSTNSAEKLKLLEEGRRIFARKWGWWCDLNLNKVPGVFP